MTILPDTNFMDLYRWCVHAEVPISEGAVAEIEQMCIDTHFHDWDIERKKPSPGNIATLFAILARFERDFKKENGDPLMPADVILPFLLDAFRTCPDDVLESFRVDFSRGALWFNGKILEIDGGLNIIPGSKEK